MTEMMKAVRLHEFGGPDVLRYEDAPRPVAGFGEVVVRVHAAGINPPDLYLRDGYRALPPEWRPNPTFPLILGTDIAGVVAAVGHSVSEFKRLHSAIGYRSPEEFETQLAQQAAQFEAFRWSSPRAALHC